MDYSQHFVGLGDPQRISAIEAAAVPSPPGGNVSVEHLFVNCRYQGVVDDKEPEDLLDHARADVASVIGRSVEKGLLEDFSSICISILGSFRSGAKRRIYRYAVESRSVPVDAGVIDERSLCALTGSLQSSEIEEVESLLNHPVS